jgi:hypothetical protein
MCAVSPAVHKSNIFSFSKESFSVFLWLWTIFIVINVCNHGEHYETPCISFLHSTSTQLRPRSLPTVPMLSVHSNCRSCDFHWPLRRGYASLLDRNNDPVRLVRTTSVYCFDCLWEKKSNRVSYGIDSIRFTLYRTMNLLRVKDVQLLLDWKCFGKMQLCHEPHHTMRL